MVVLFRFEGEVVIVGVKETKGAIRWQEVNTQGEDLDIGVGAVVGSFYTRKSAWPNGWPKGLRVTVEPMNA